MQIDRSHYLEARTWLVADLASLQPDGQAREQAWQTLLPKPGSKYREGEENLVMQLFVLMSELWPKDMGSLLHDRPDVFVDFFSGKTMCAAVR